ncbi:hypothetical protein L0668_10960 [Paraglaciecola aquimarina]|uniref:ZU5 domain-containing protein n=1 Tax=Paraglaciecola algarum TaxID=3050085 RepID=A0ABS9D6N4_9ALTE|nr:hypothetical protein [Paraglaciecola sp. G1-23]MCF2948627.1 hypothetical protein [Paraglaciecola sp. G1-23]
MTSIRIILSALILVTISACGSGGDTSQEAPETNFNVTTSVTEGGSVSPTALTIESGQTTNFSLTANDGYQLSSITGCGGTLTGSTYVTAGITANCEVTVSFIKTSNVSGVAQLGLISGASVKLYELPEMLLVAETSSSSMSESYGAFNFDGVVIKDSSFYLVEVDGGQDTDPNDDGVVVSDEVIDILGKISAIVKGSQLTENQIRVTALSDIQALFLRLNNNTYELSDTSLLDDIAASLIQDINDDGVVNSLDLLLFNPLENKNSLKVSYTDLINGYIDSIHNGADISNKLFDLVSLLPPTLSIDGGSFQQVPFTLNGLISNYPHTLTPQWLLDGEVVELENSLTITEAGSRLLTVNFFNEDVLVTTADKLLVAYEADLIAEKVITVDDGGVIALNSDNAPETLAGTKIIVPAGALSEQQTIRINQNSASIIPSTQGVFSSVVTFEPAGLQFNQAVTVAIPVFENLDEVGVDSLRIARTDENGVIDYLSPIKFDAEESLVYFETDHFSSYVVINKDIEDALTDGYGDPLLQSIVADIENRFAGEYSKLSNNDWLAYLSTEIASVGADQTALTVFDVYQSVVTAETIKGEIARNGQSSTVLGGAYQGYVAAFESLYGTKASPQGGVLSEWNFAQKMIESPFDMLLEEAEKKFFKHPSLTRSYLAFKSASGDVGEAGDRVNDIFSDRFPADISETNIISKLLNLYKEKLLSVGGKIVSDFSDITVNKQIETYFLQRQFYSSDYLLELMRDDDFIDDAGEGLVNGWFYAGDLTPSGTIPDNFWEMVEGLYLQSVSANTQNSRLKAMLDAAIELENIEVPANDFYIQSYQLGNENQVNFDNQWDNSDIEVSVVANQSFTVSFTLLAEGDEDYINSFTPEFHIRSLPKKCYFCQDDLSGLTYQVVGAVNLYGGEVSVIDVEFTYAGSAQEIDYQIQFKHQGTSTSNRKLSIKRKALNLAPTIAIDANQKTSFSAGTNVELSATASDPDGSVSIEWFILPAHSINYDGQGDTLSFTAPDVSEVEKIDLIAVATDNQGKESSDSVQITIRPKSNFLLEDVDKFSSDFLTGRRLYNVHYETGLESWILAVFDFDGNQIKAYADGAPGTVYKTSYSLTSQGYIKFNSFDGEGVEYINITSATESYLELAWTNDLQDINLTEQDEYFLLDYQTAKSFLENKINSNAKPDSSQNAPYVIDIRIIGDASESALVVKFSEDMQEGYSTEGNYVPTSTEWRRKDTFVMFLSSYEPSTNIILKKDSFRSEEGVPLEEDYVFTLPDS